MPSELPPSIRPRPDMLPGSELVAHLGLWQQRSSRVEVLARRWLALERTPGKIDGLQTYHVVLVIFVHSSNLCVD
jgi:hypothetical protein